MKKTALLFIAALVIMANIDFIWPFTSERKDGDVFEQGLNTAEMQRQSSAFVLTLPFHQYCNI